ncbi:hypothetical protein TRFO_07772 [Tritrichomonas foetus]|uniref:Uncharacterized protein n=1 Tax=Tritrichomonas foetus TaxID=1144522 RepID=A0A1J4JQW0_9EUKA|nr:hypothetical protein TRFO_07772 [Tritrichomonas foetus]|eukprot:OHT00792.1 hypothetical protein TRFO_07772 [Tritrichomonas foetus]
MDVSYKENYEQRSNIAIVHENETRIDDSHNENYKSDYIQIFKKIIPELIEFYINEEFDKYHERCNHIAISISSMPISILESKELMELNDFICHVIHECSYSDVIYSTLLILPPIFSKQSLSIANFYIDHDFLSNIQKILCSNDDMNEIICDNPQMIELILLIFSFLVKSTPNGLNNAFPTYLLSYDALQQILDKFPNSSSVVLQLCSSVLQYWPHDFIHRDELITIGFSIFSPKNGENYSFILSLCRLVKTDPEAIYETLVSNLSTDDSSFIQNIVNWLNNDLIDFHYYVLKFIYSLIKHIPKQRANILSYLDPISLLNFAMSDNFQIRAVSYQLLSNVIITNSGLISNLFQPISSFLPNITETDNNDTMNSIASQFEHDLENGNYLLRKATLSFIKNIMTYGKFIPQTNMFYCKEFLFSIVNFLGMTDSENIMQLILETIHMIAQKAKIDHNLEVLNVLNDQQTIEIIQNLPQTEKISIFITFIANIVNSISQQ